MILQCEGIVNKVDFLLGKNVIHLNIFYQCRSTGLPVIEIITFGFVHDNVGVECAVLCAAHSTLKQYKLAAFHAFKFTA